MRSACDLSVANDPDADRLAIAVREGNGMRMLTGNQIGTLLGAYLLAARTQRPALVATSVVSSHQLCKRLAELHGAGLSFETLTGFKWIANGAIDRQKQGEFLFGYEEALGFTVGSLVRDKDGISAALLFAELHEAWLKAQRPATPWPTTSERSPVRPVSSRRSKRVSRSKVQMGSSA